MKLSRKSLFAGLVFLWPDNVNLKKDEMDKIVYKLVFNRKRALNSQGMALVQVEAYMDGRKRYRTVFRADELSTLYVDTEFVNLQYGRKTWKARLEGLLFGMEGEQATLVAHRAGELEIPSTEAEVNLATDFRPEDCGGMELCEGAYRVQMVIDGVAAVSDEICVVEARGGWREYMTLLGCGLNRTADAKENLQRMDSYAALKHDPEGKVCLFLLAENKLGREWTYEFELSVATADGVSKGCRTIKAPPRFPAATSPFPPRNKTAAPRNAPAARNQAVRPPLPPRNK